MRATSGGALQGRSGADRSTPAWHSHDFAEVTSRPGTRAPLWQQRKRAADLLAVASRFGSFPVLLETYR